MKKNAQDFLDQAVRWQDVDDATLSYRVFGSGPPLLLVHGWPLWGFTYRNIVPALMQHYQCYVVDLAGAGLSRFGERTDFTLGGQARNLARLVERLDLKSLSVMSHDTGATIARELYLHVPDRIRRLVLIDTEIPNHRPPLVPLMQKLLGLPGSSTVFRYLLGSRHFVRSSFGFGDCFYDKSFLDGDFEEHIIQPLVEDPARLEGHMRYARGIDWQLVDDLEHRHRQIACPVLLVWGEHDTFFPVEEARKMTAQFPDCRGLHVVKRAKLLPHEEHPDEVAGVSLNFLA